MVRSLAVFVTIICLFSGCSSKDKEEKIDFIDDQTALLTEQEKDRIIENLELLENAIYNYMSVNSKYEMCWPKSFDDLIPDYLNRIPEPIGGKWVYEPTSGKVYNSVFPEIETKRVRLNIAPMLEKEKENQIKGNLGALRSAITMYYALNERFPDSLEDLVPQKIVLEIPSPIDGDWEYDPENGMVWHSLDHSW